MNETEPVDIKPIEPKPIELRLSVDVNSFMTLYSEVVQIEASADRIILSFLQRLPGEEPDQPNAKVVSRVALTWPHFARLLVALNATMDQGREQAKKQFLDNVFPVQKDHE